MALAVGVGRRLEQHVDRGAYEVYRWLDGKRKRALRLDQHVVVGGAHVQLARHDADAVDTFTAGVNRWDEVVACHALTGEMDYLLQVVVQDLEHFSRFLLDHLLNASGVADVNSSFVLRTVKQARGLPLGHLG